MLTLVIQAGGESRRMGQDKALMPFLGKPLIQRVLERLSHLADEVVITTNNPEPYRFLVARLAADLLPGRGALGGLYTALSVASHPLVAVIACDMPFANPSLLAALRDRVITTHCDAAIPRSQSGLEPFHAVYRKETCLHLVQAALQANQWRVDSWFEGAAMAYLSPDEVRLYDPHGLAFLNVNTPEDLMQAEERARELDQP